MFVKMRRLFIFMVTVVSYILFVFYFFGKSYLIPGIWYLPLCYVFLHYFLIEFKDIEHENIIWILLIAAIFEMFLIGFTDFGIILSLYLFHLSLIFLIKAINSEINNRKIIYSFGIFTAWNGIFVLCLSLTFSVWFIWKYNEFTLTCNKLYEMTYSTINAVSGTFNLPIELKQWELEKTIWLTPKEVILQNKKYSQLAVFSGSEVIFGTGDNIAFGTGLLAATGVNLQEIDIDAVLSWFQKDDSLEKYNDFKISYLIDKEFWKAGILNQLVKDKKLVDKTFCQIMIDNISDKYDDPTFKLSVILLLFILFYPFLKLLFFFISFLNYLLFMLLRLARVYKFQRITEEVEEII